MSKKTHWSRKPEQIRRDAEFLLKAGLVFDKTPSGFNRMCSAESKEKLDGANDSEHERAQKIWAENIEELREV
jgi:hypothetical protein